MKCLLQFRSKGCRGSALAVCLRAGGSLRGMHITCTLAALFSPVSSPLQAWQPILTPFYVVLTFLVIGGGFVGLGFFLKSVSDGVVEYRAQYDGEGTPASALSCMMGPVYNASNPNVSFGGCPEADACTHTHSLPVCACLSPSLMLPSPPPRSPSLSLPADSHPVHSQH